MTWRVTVYSRPESQNLYLQARNGKKKTGKTAGTPDRTMAEKLAKEWQRLLNGAEAGDTLGNVWDAHRLLRDGEGWKASTANNYAAAIKRIDPALLSKPITSIKGEDLARLRDDLVLHYAPNTARGTIACLRGVWRWAHQRGLVSEWPGCPKIKTKHTSKRGLTAYELARVLAYLQGYLGGRWYGYFALLTATGARASEILSLRGADIDRGSREIIIRNHKTDSDVGVKTIAVPRDLIAQLPVRAADDLLFPKVRSAYRDGKPTVPRVTLKVLRTALVACGINDPNVDQHSLRRSWITLSHRMGVPMAVSMQQTGHQSPTTHLKYQKNASSDAAHDAVENLWARLWAESPQPRVAEPLKSSEFLPLCEVPASC